MSKTIISEGKTTTEAIENGLKELKVSKNQVDIKVLEEEHKKSFFSILTPRVVRVELTIKENVNTNTKISTNTNIDSNEAKPEREYEHDENILNNSKNNIDEFLKVFLNKIDTNLNFNIKIEDDTIFINIYGHASGCLIGYRGETLNSLQNILTTIGNKNSNNKIKVVLDIENYREKREKVLEGLAEKMAKNVLKTGKSITLEPMTAYERKIIHQKLQENDKIDTYSIGEGINRRVVISKKVNN